MPWELWDIVWWRDSHVRCIVLGYSDQPDSAASPIRPLPGTFCFTLRPVPSYHLSWGQSILWPVCSHSHIWWLNYHFSFWGAWGRLDSSRLSHNDGRPARPVHSFGGAHQTSGAPVCLSQHISYYVYTFGKWRGGQGRKTTPIAFLKQISERKAQPSSSKIHLL